MQGYQPRSKLDRAMKRACDKFAIDISALSHDTILRESLLRVAVCRFVQALEQEFEGYEDILSASLLELGVLVGTRT